MRISKGLALGIVGALLAGGAELLAETAIGAATSAEDPLTAIDVPVGRVGDRVTYETFVRTNPQQTLEFRSQVDYTLASIGTFRDRAGLEHQALFLVMDANYSLPAPNQPLSSSRRVDYVLSLPIDLETRHMLGWFAVGKVTPTSPAPGQAGVELSMTLHGPFRGEGGVVGDLRYAKEEDLFHQGRRFEVGQNLDDLAKDLLVYSGWYTINGYDSVGARAYDVTATGQVRPAVDLDGRTALPLAFSGCLRVEAAPDGPPWKEAPSPGGDPPVPSASCFERVQYVTADSPYPVRYESRLYVDGTLAKESVSVRASYTAGTQPIPWGPDDRPHFRDADPALERTPTTQRHPADGSNSSLLLPLSAALRQVEQDATLTEFRAWRADHPNAELVGARLKPIGADRRGQMWALVYAVPPTDGFLLTVERQHDGAPIVVASAGRTTTPAFRLEDLPRGPLTLGAMEHLWNVFRADRPAVRNFNFVNWGLWYATLTVQASPLQPVGPDTVLVPVEGLDTVRFGYSPDLQPSGRARTYPIPMPLRGIVPFEGADGFDSLLANATTGNVYASNQHRPAFDAERWVGERTDPGVPVEAKGNAGVPVSPDPVRAFAFTSALLFLVLAAYFFPLLKAFGGHALLFVPGYAKVHKAQLLDNRLREALSQAIKADPGITAPELRRITGAGWTTIIYHLRMLEKNRLVSSIIDARHRRYFPTETVNASDREGISLLRNLRTKALYEILCEEPGLDRHDLARRLGISRPATYWHLDRLEKGGFVGQDRDGRKIRFYPLENPLPTRRLDPRDAVEVA